MRLVEVWRPTWRVPEDEGAELVSSVKHAPVSTGLAGVPDGLFPGVDVLEDQSKHKTVSGRQRCNWKKLLPIMFPLKNYQRVLLTIMKLQDPTYYRPIKLYFPSS